MPARRMRHREIAGYDFVGIDIDKYAAALFVFAPAARSVSLAKCSDPFGTSLDNAEPIEMAAIVWRKLRDELGPPDWREAVVRIVRRQTGETRVNKPKFVVAKCLRNLVSEFRRNSATVRHLMNL